jgi:hypothetical protein
LTHLKITDLLAKSGITLTITAMAIKPDITQDKGDREDKTTSNPVTSNQINNTRQIVSAVAQAIQQ